MNFKNFFIKNKKFVITGAISIILGLSFGYEFNPDQGQLDDYISKNQTAISQIQEIQLQEKSYKSEIAGVEEKKANLVNEKRVLLEQEQLAKEEAEKKAKEEEERKAKEETDRLAREEADKKKQEEAKVAKEKAETEKKTQASSSNNKSNSNEGTTEPVGQMVWRTKSGKKYHSKNNCGNTDTSSARQITIKDAKAAGLTACTRC